MQGGRITEEDYRERLQREDFRTGAGGDYRGGGGLQREITERGKRTGAGEEDYKGRVQRKEEYFRDIIEEEITEGDYRGREAGNNRGVVV